MKSLKLLGLCLLLFVSLLSGCSQEGPNTENIGAFIAPVEFYSFDSFEAAIQAAKNDQDSEYALDDYALDELTEYYIPTYFGNSLNLDAICVKKRYVCIYYYLQDLSEMSFETAEQEEAAIIANTVKFEWRRVDDAKQEMAALIESLSLVQVNDGLCYTDISLPTSPSNILSRSYYWIQNGQVFELMIPYTMLQNLPNTVSADAGMGLLGITQVSVG